jgi:hypothetical protein
VAQQQFNRNQIPIKGLYTSAVADSLGPEYAPWCQNVRFRFGQIQKCPGRSVMLANRGASDYLLDFATHTDITGNKTIFSLEQAASGNQAAPYTPYTWSFGTPLALSPSTVNSYRFSWAGGEERLLTCRGSVIDAISRSTAGVFSVEHLTSPPGLYLEYFKNHVFLMNTIDVANRLQWSARANYADWLTTTGHGGFLDLYDGAVEPINNGKILGDRLVVYRQSSITDIAATGDDTNPFLPEGRVYGIGCVAPWTLANVGQFHIFLGNDFNVYSWDGVNLNPIGTPIHSYVRQLFDPATLTDWFHVPYAAAFMGFKEYWLVFPPWAGGAGSGAITTVLIYDYLRDTWCRDTFTDLTALAEHRLPGPTATAGYNGTGYPIEFPTMMAGQTNKYFMIDERVDGDRLMRPADGGIDMWVDTPDMFYDKMALQNATLERVMVSEGKTRTAGDVPYQLQVSIDRGDTYASAQDIQPLATHWGFEFVDENITSNVRRYRFMYLKERGAAFPSLRAYSEVYVPAGEFFPTDRPVGTTLVNVPPTGVDTREVRAPVGGNEAVSTDLR